MSWFPVDDAFHGHPKGRKAGLEAIGLWTICGSYCMAYLTDGFVPEWFVKEKPRGASLAKKLVAAGLWSPSEKSDGEPGWQFHDWKPECTKSHVLAERRASAARQEVARNPQLRGAIRERDRDICRYCGTPVEWHNRRGPTGGTYDHVVPNGGTTIDNLVVCCRGCNSKKGRRTPEQAGMKVLPVPKSGVRSDSNRESDESRSVLGVTLPIPTHTNIPLVDLGGEVTQVAEPSPRCLTHKNHTDPPPCHGCRKARLANESWHSEQQQNELARRREIKAAIDACPSCDDRGMYQLHDDTLARCDHGLRLVENLASGGEFNA